MLSSVTLSYSGRNYTLAGYDQSLLKGRLACDCEKSILIRAAYDPQFPVLKCGARISVVSMFDCDQAGQDMAAVAKA